MVALGIPVVDRGTAVVGVGTSEAVTRGVVTTAVDVGTPVVGTTAAVPGAAARIRVGVTRAVGTTGADGIRVVIPGADGIRVVTPGVGTSVIVMAAVVTHAGSTADVARAAVKTATDAGRVVATGRTRAAENAATPEVRHAPGPVVRRVVGSAGIHAPAAAMVAVGMSDDVTTAAGVMTGVAGAIVGGRLTEEAAAPEIAVDVGSTVGVARTSAASGHRVWETAEPTPSCPRAWPKLNCHEAFELSCAGSPRTSPTGSANASWPRAC